MSDSGRDSIAEGLGTLFGWVAEIPGPIGAVLVAVVVAVVTIKLITSAFPMKQHGWCKGSGHWGIGPFRRRCGACSGSGLVER